MRGAACRPGQRARRAGDDARRAAWTLTAAACLVAACGTTAPLDLLGRTPTPTPPVPGPVAVSAPPVPVPAPAAAAAAVRAPAPAPATGDCASAALAGMGDAQRAGQLLMVGVPSGDPRAAGAIAAIRAQHAGGVVLFGAGWSGSARVSGTVAAVQAAARAAEGVGLLVAGNQEGGAPGTFQAFYGPGFTSIPPAPSQGEANPGALAAAARLWGAQLSAAGVDVDLAPVVDVVPPGGNAASGAVGALGRELGHDASSVAVHGAAVVRGLAASGVAATLKHFPGLGRVPGDTDTAATGITDTVTGPGDPFLAPFAAGIAAGARLVMVSTAIYTRIDAGSAAAFSPAVISGLLRGRLGFGGVVVSDDLGASRSVAAVPVGDRAVRFVAAGGDIVLTVVPAQAAAMEAALSGRMARDSGFRAAVAAAALRVLRLKVTLGLVPDCPR